MQFSHKFLLSGLELAALSSNATLPGQPILCLHGWLDNAASFLPLAKQLKGLPLLALEFPGHGHSSHRGPDAAYYFFDWVQDLVALCQQQQWQDLTIIGHSMGGMVATALAASFPELVKQLVLIDSLGFVVADEATAAGQLRLGIESRLKPQPSRVPCYPSLKAAAEARLKQSDFTLTEAMLLAERGTVQQADGFRWRADMRLRQQSVYRLSPAQAKALIAAVECPVLAVLAQDGMFKEQGISWQPYYHRLRHQRVIGGHHCHMTEAKQVAVSIQQFLSAAS
ncbi:alpha/beta hydrolase [Alkalimonas amylolytica]|uniref:Pimeloyl-ACP methyl ester carboxylesterase n=1 Tax=Alkalimonas amylolytica TaxID=152573 RepID=A0A1H4EW52_ALKAM|nr:alpha/beta hydrolase [Alkalimonas amylolytica]SEA89179.1 Pimeloyl-ACP methyl ester carboxylesterase [Alkalimonas amylolytica]